MLLLCAGLIAGCGVIGSGGVDGPVIYSAPSGDGEDAQIFGTLSLEDDCLLLTFEDIRYPVVWPNGTRWDTEQQAVVLPDGALAHVGDFVQGGGGYHQPDHVARVSNAAGSALAEQCAQKPFGEVAMFNANDDVTVEEGLGG